MILTIIIIIAVCVAAWLTYEFTHAYEMPEDPVNQQEDEDFSHMDERKELIVDSKGRMFEIDNRVNHCGYETGEYPL